MCGTLTVVMVAHLQVKSEISVFEFNIRFVGGLLSAYALSGDEVSSHYSRHSRANIELQVTRHNLTSSPGTSAHVELLRVLTFEPP